MGSPICRSGALSDPNCVLLRPLLVACCVRSSQIQRADRSEGGSQVKTHFEPMQCSRLQAETHAAVRHDHVSSRYPSNNRGLDR